MKQINGFNKMIVVQWTDDDAFYDMAMHVVESTHERFVKGSRFDFGFFHIATQEGYTILSIPMEE